MSWTLFLDDERFPKIEENFVIARNFNEAVELVRARGCPSFISFDHDLGDNSPTGKDFANWLIESDLNGEINLPDDFKFHVHSANPVGRDNIISILNSYLLFKKGTNK